MYKWYIHTNERILCAIRTYIMKHISRIIITKKKKNMFALKQLKNVSKLTLKSNMVLSTRKSISNSKSLFMSQTNSQDQQKAKVMDLLNTLQTRSTFTNTLGKLEFHKVWKIFYFIILCLLFDSFLFVCFFFFCLKVWKWWNSRDKDECYRSCFKFGRYTSWWSNCNSNRVNKHIHSFLFLIIFLWYSFITTVSVGLADRTGRVGVSTDLNVSYFRPAPKDTVVYFHSKVAKHAKAMGNRWMIFFVFVWNLIHFLFFYVSFKSFCNLWCEKWKRWIVGIWKTHKISRNSNNERIISKW